MKTLSYVSILCGVLSLTNNIPKETLLNQTTDAKVDLIIVFLKVKLKKVHALNLINCLNKKGKSNNNKTTKYLKKYIKKYKYYYIKYYFQIGEKFVAKVGFDTAENGQSNVWGT